MRQPRSTLQAWPAISDVRLASLAKASIAETRHRSWTRSSARQIEVNDEKHFCADPGSKARGCVAASSLSFPARFPRARFRNSKERQAASALQAMESDLKGLN